MKKKLNIIFMGTPDFAVPSLKALAKYHCNIDLVITQPDRPKGRGKKIIAPPVKTAAMQLGLDIIQPRSMNEEKIKKKISDLQPDIFVVVAFGHKLSREILAIPSIFPINIHASLLPKYRGSSPIQAAILNMDKEAGVTTMVMNEGLDTGDILLKTKTSVKCETTALDLHDTLAEMGANLIIKTLDAISENTITPVPQNHNIATFAPMLKKNDGKINWKNEPEKINALVRAMTPWPGAFTFLQGKRIKVLKISCTKQNEENNNIAIDHTQVQHTPLNVKHAPLKDTGKNMDQIKEIQIKSDKKIQHNINQDIKQMKHLIPGANIEEIKNIEPGTIFLCDSRGIHVAAGNAGYVTILELQAAGGKRLSACEFLKGKKLRTGTRFDL